MCIYNALFICKEGNQEHKNYLRMFNIYKLYDCTGYWRGLKGGAMI